MFALLKSIWLPTLIAINSSLTEFPPPEKNDVAEDLQRQIDHLRKQIKGIMQESEVTEDPDTVANLKNQIEELQVQLQELYTHLDQLSSELKQEFRQKLDTLAVELFEDHKNLEDRIKDLEELVQQITISQCIGNLRDGNVETAIGSFRHIKNPNLHIEQIISEAYQNVNDCRNLMDFLKKVEYERGLKIKIKNEIRIRGYSSLYNHLNNVQFYAEGSHCTYPLAWNVNEIQNRLQKEEINTKNVAIKILARLPKSVSKFAVEKVVKLYIPPQNPEREIQTCYRNEKGRLFIINDQHWNTTQTKDGIWFMLFNQDERPLFLKTDTVSGTPDIFLSRNNYKDMVENPRALWKPVAISNSQFYLENKEGGPWNARYTAHNNVQGGGFECYKFSLADYSYKFVYNVD